MRLARRRPMARRLEIPPPNVRGDARARLPTSGLAHEASDELVDPDESRRHLVIRPRKVGDTPMMRRH